MYFRIWETLYLCKWCNITDQPMSEKFRDEDGRFNKSNPQQSDIVFLLHTVLQVRHTLYSAKETQLKIIIFRKKENLWSYLLIIYWSLIFFAASDWNNFSVTWRLSRVPVTQPQWAWRPSLSVTLSKTGVRGWSGPTSTGSAMWTTTHAQTECVTTAVHLRIRLLITNPMYKADRKAIIVLVDYLTSQLH